VLVGPTLGLLAVFFVVPVFAAACTSLWSWDLLTPPRFVGLANYAAVARYGSLTHIALRTLAYSVIVVAGTVALGLGLALALNHPGRVFAVARASVFSAYVVSWVAVALLWMALLDDTAGPVGRALRSALGQNVSLLGDPRLALPTLALVGVWKLTGYAMIVLLAALQDIPASLHEAAALDGAGAWERFRHVTLPSLLPALGFTATTLLVASFQAFDVVRVVTQGGPGHATELFVYAIYEQVFLDFRVGRASALAVVFFVLLLGLAHAQLRAWQVRGRRA
jgi:sn-glycerol 3-phosphate transport system permease protein